METHKYPPLIADLEGCELSQSDRDFLAHPKLGGLILFSRNYESYEQLKSLIQAIRSERTDLFICVDQEGGRVQRFRNGFSRIPPMRRLGERFESEDQTEALEDARALGLLMAAELVSLDIDLSFAPVLDLYDAESRVIGDRAFSSDSGVVVQVASAFIEGMRSAGMHACAKHFPGHGGVIEDSHMELPVDTRSLDDVMARDAVPFAQLANTVSAVMTAHIQFSAVSEHPVSFSDAWIQKVLRATLGFNGFVFSDDLSMKGAAGIESFADRAKTALQAGCDAVLICNNRSDAEQALDELDRDNVSSSRNLSSLRHDRVDFTPELQEKLKRARVILEKYQD